MIWAAPNIDLHLDLMAPSVLALDLLDSLVELDLLDLNDALVEGHIARIRDGEVGRGPGSWRKLEERNASESTFLWNLDR